MHYYPHHIGDFIADTARLSDSQCMAYLRLIWQYYDTEQPLLNDPDSLAFKIGSSAQDVALILKHYFVLDGDLWLHARCEKVLSEYRGKSDKARNSANARWKNANALRMHSERNADESKSDANQEPITNNQEPVKESKEKSKRFSPPTLSEVADFFFNEGDHQDADTDAQAFIDYYTSNGWKVGKNAMKSWQGAGRNWLRRKAEREKELSAKTQGYMTAREKSAARNAEIFDISKAVVF
jgi:uncharacterized protein YdaU (DUF1376 family)